VQRIIKALRRFVTAFGVRGIVPALQFLPLEFGRDKRVRTINIPVAPAPIHLRNGTTDKDIFRQIFIKREYDLRGFAQSELVEGTYRRAVANGGTPLILDCGANIGLSAAWLAIAFPQARIYAIEPDPGNFEMLTANTAPYPNVTPLRGAIWDRHEPVSIADPSAPEWGFRVAEAAAKPSDLPVFTIPELMAKAGARDILLVKIDIEGGEKSLFRSNTDWMGQTTAIAIELHDWLLPGEGTSHSFLGGIARYPFEIAFRGETLFCFRVPPPA
jgi:FkbM family methyltransferase